MASAARGGRRIAIGARGAASAGIQARAFLRETLLTVAGGPGGLASAAIALSLVFTGVFLAFHFRPAPDWVRTDLSDIVYAEPLGPWLRSVHQWAAMTALAFAVANAASVFVRPSENGGRRRLSALAWLLVVVAFMVTGRRLSFAGGGDDGTPLLRAYVWHALLLSAFAFALWRGRRNAGRDEAPGPSAGDRLRLDAAAAMALLALVGALAILWPASLSPSGSVDRQVAVFERVGVPIAVGLAAVGLSSGRRSGAARGTVLAAALVVLGFLLALAFRRDPVHAFGTEPFPPTPLPRVLGFPGGA